MPNHEFLEVIEQVEAEQSQVASELARLAGDRSDGARIRSQRSARFLEGMAFAAKLYRDVTEGRRRWGLLKEAMSTSDFPLYLAGVLDRGLMARYQETPSTWQAYCTRGTLRDFRTAEIFDITGAEGVLTEVGQLVEYPQASLGEARVTWKAKKYGRRLPLSWEAYVNDDLDAFSSIPDRFARATRRTEDKLATTLHIDASGPHASVYTSGNKNIINTANGAASNNPALSIVGLQDAFKVLAKMVDTDGEPILIEAAVLEVCPALEVTARNILNATQIVVREAGGTANQDLWAENWMRAKLTLVVNPYIPIVATTANGATTWGVHAAPSAGRAPFKIGFLRGYEEPGLYIKSPNARRAGGGDIDPFEGDFDTDSVEHKVRHCVAAAVIDAKTTVASNGSGA